MSIQSPVFLHTNFLENCKLLPDRASILDYIPKHGIGAEIGVLGGDWSKLLLQKLQPNEITLIDTFYSNDYPEQNRFSKQTHENYIKNEFSRYGEVVKVKKGMSWEVMRTMPSNYFDWIYIDAGHDYESVKKDLEESGRCLKNDGFIIMNDYTMYDQFAKEDYGVIQATNEFMIQNEFEMLYFALHPNMFCDVVIRKVKF